MSSEYRPSHPHMSPRTLVEEDNNIKNNNDALVRESEQRRNKLFILLPFDYVLFVFPTPVWAASILRVNFLGGVYSFLMIAKEYEQHSDRDNRLFSLCRVIISERKNPFKLVLLFAVKRAGPCKCNFHVELQPPHTGDDG